MDNGNELDAFRLPVGSLPMRRKEKNSHQPIPRQRGAFIRGPIPLAWLDGVLNLPGRGPLVVALALMLLTSSMISVRSAVCYSC